MKALTGVFNYLIRLLFRLKIAGATLQVDLFYSYKTTGVLNDINKGSVHLGDPVLGPLYCMHAGSLTLLTGTLTLEWSPH